MKTKLQIQKQIDRVIDNIYMMCSNKRIRKIYGKDLKERLKETWSDFSEWVYRK